MGRMNKRRRLIPLTVVLSLGLALALLVGIAVGPVYIPLKQALFAVIGQLPGVNFSHLPATVETIIVQIRVPRVLLGLVVGAGLASSGVVMQGLFRNPLATPYILGVASGGSAGAAAVILLGTGGSIALPLGATLGATSSVLAVYGLAYTRRGVSTYTLILAGVALSALFSAITTMLIFFAGPHEQSRILFWIMGGLWRADWNSLGVIAPVVLSGIGASFFWSRDLNALALGENVATHLGVEPETVKRILLAITTVTTAFCVAAAGTIGFIGLIVPHAFRLIIGPDHRFLLPLAALGGGSFLILTDVIAKVALKPVEIPVGAITAFFGAPFFLYLLRNGLPEGPGSSR